MWVGVTVEEDEEETEGGSRDVHSIGLPGETEEQGEGETSASMPTSPKLEIKRYHAAMLLLCLLHTHACARRRAHTPPSAVACLHGCLLHLKVAKSGWHFARARSKCNLFALTAQT